MHRKAICSLPYRQIYNQDRRRLQTFIVAAACASNTMNLASNKIHLWQFSACHFARTTTPPVDGPTASARHIAVQAAPLELGRRMLHFQTVSSALLAEVTLPTNDAKTLVNSILGAYGLPKLKSSLSFRAYEDLNAGIFFEYPRSWIKRANHLRPGLNVSDYNTSDKVVLEQYNLEELDDPATQLVGHFVNPGQEIGGDARLVMPPERSIQSGTSEIDGGVYTYVNFPSETITRSGYQIRRKNFGVTATKKGTTYSLVASARSDQYDGDKEALLQHIVASFRIQA